MAFIEPNPNAAADNHVQAVYARQAKAFGYLPNYAPLFSHRPDVIDLWADLQRGLRNHVTPRMFELGTFARLSERNGLWESPPGAANQNSPTPHKTLTINNL